MFCKPSQTTTEMSSCRLAQQKRLQIHTSSKEQYIFPCVVLTSCNLLQFPSIPSTGSRTILTPDDTTCMTYPATTAPQYTPRSTTQGHFNVTHEGRTLKPGCHSYKVNLYFCDWDKAWNLHFQNETDVWVRSREELVAPPSSTSFSSFSSWIRRASPCRWPGTGLVAVALSSTAAQVALQCGTSVTQVISP